MGGDIDANFLHHLDSQRVNVARRFGAGTLDIEYVTGGCPENSFGEVAAAGVAGAEN